MLTLDGGVAAIRLHQRDAGGIGPTAVNELRAVAVPQRNRKPLPAAPQLTDPRDVANAAEYAGTFTAATTKRLCSRRRKRLFLDTGSEKIPLQQPGAMRFYPDRGRYADYPIVFGRKEEDTREAGGRGEKTQAEPSSRWSYGPAWYSNASYTEREFCRPTEWQQYAGRYRCDSHGVATRLCLVLKDKLTISGSRFAYRRRLFRPETSRGRRRLRVSACFLKATRLSKPGDGFLALEVIRLVFCKASPTN